MQRVLGVLGILSLLTCVFVFGGCSADSDTSTITLASTTSPENSGLYEYLLPKFRQETGIEVRALPVGTGKAIRIGRDGGADAVFVHNEKLETQFVADGFGVERICVMSNEFIVVGPPSDPAGVRGLKDVAGSFRKIATTKSTFISRGDESGTHLRERGIWKHAAVDPTPASGTWYLESGSGMGATLNVAVGKGAYCLTDSSTWGAFKNKGDLEVLVRADPMQVNSYVFMVCAQSQKRALAQKFVDWLVGPAGQAAIGAFEVNGAQLFVPNPAR